MITRLFPGTEGKVEYHGYYRMAGDALVCTREYGAQSFELVTYSPNLNDLVKGASSALRQLSESEVQYSVDLLDIRVESESKSSLVVDSFLQGGLLASLLTFALGILIPSSFISSPWLVPAVILGLAAIVGLYVPVYVFILPRRLRHVM